MSMMVSDYFYAKQVRQEAPAWYRLERYDYCDRIDVNALSAKRGLFARLAGKKRSK